MSMKKTNKYLFTVPGETEMWYFEWLQGKINSTPESKYDVSLKCSIQKNPLKYAKGLSVLGKTEVYHFADYESNDPCHVKDFTDTMDNMKKAKSLGKQIDYKFAYTNFAFDLWIVLHKADCNGSFNYRSDYRKPLNKAFDEQFESMDKYKKEDNFKRILDTLTLDDVVNAVKRAERIMLQNQQNGYILHEYKGYRYYKENPSLMVHEVIRKILSKCGLLT